jgi:hypothetical protein
MVVVQCTASGGGCGGRRLLDCYRGACQPEWLISVNDQILCKLLSIRGNVIVRVIHISPTDIMMHGLCWQGLGP